MPINVVVNNLDITSFLAGGGYLPEVSFELPLGTDITNYDQFQIYMRPAGCSPPMYTGGGCAPSYSLTAAHETLTGFTSGPGVGYDETDLTTGQPGNPIVLPLSIPQLYHNYAPLTYDVYNNGTLYGVDWNIVVVATCLLPNGNSTVQVFSNGGDTMITSTGVTFIPPANLTVVYGCMDPLYIEYDEFATTPVYSDGTNPDGSALGGCLTLDPNGCLDPAAFNYDVNNYWITSDDGTTCYPVITGCMDTNATNYVTPTGDVQVDINTSDSNACIFAGCMDETSTDYWWEANQHDPSSCTDTMVVGCRECGTIWENDAVANPTGITCYQNCIDIGLGSAGACNAMFGAGNITAGATNFLSTSLQSWDWYTNQYGSVPAGYGTGPHWPCTY